MDARELEVRCSGCGAGFAIGTQRCIHCGLPLGARRASPLRALQDADSNAEDAPAESARLNGLVSGAIMVALVVTSALMRACS